MFDTLSSRLTSIFDKIRGRGFLNEDDIASSLREIRVALLEADVAVLAVKEIIERVRIRASGKEILKSVTPGQMMIKFVHEELINFLGNSAVPLNFHANSPFSFLMVGLQGSGKTTTTAKLANIIKKNKNVLLASLDIYRPAAREQLQLLAQKIGVETLPIIEEENVEKIVDRAISYAKKSNIDLIIFDTAGRMNTDNDMMQELKLLQEKTNPVETLLVLDSMTGQDAINIAQAFSKTVKLTGIIMTRTDGDARGGASISVRYITGCPIKFLGTGEHIEDLIPFDPQRIADQILDKGDIIGLVEKAIQSTETDKFAKIQKRMEKGKFDMFDMKAQLEQLLKIGGVAGVLKMIPGAKKIANCMNEKMQVPDNKVIARQIAFIESMTDKEKKNPDILNASRRKRIAFGAGQDVAALNRLLKQYNQLRDITKKMSSSKNEKMNLKNIINSLK